MCRGRVVLRWNSLESTKICLVVVYRLEAEGFCVAVSNDREEQWCSLKGKKAAPRKER